MNTHQHARPANVSLPPVESRENLDVVPTAHTLNNACAHQDPTERTATEPFAHAVPLEPGSKDSVSTLGASAHADNGAHLTPGDTIQSLRRMQNQQPRQQNSEQCQFDPRKALLGLAFDMRCWLALERDNASSHETKKQDLLALVLGLIALLLLTIAANNSGAFR